MKNENGDYSTNINYERRKQQRDTEEMLDRISSLMSVFCKGIRIVVKADSMEELEERTEKIKSSVRPTTWILCHIPINSWMH